MNKEIYTKKLTDVMLSMEEQDLVVDRWLGPGCDVEFKKEVEE